MRLNLCKGSSPSNPTPRWTQTVGTYPSSEALDSTGSFLYTNLGAFSITNGTITLLGPIGSYLAFPFYASPNSPVLFAAGTGSATLTSSLIGANGSLTEAPGSPYTVAG